MAKLGLLFFLFWAPFGWANLYFRFPLAQDVKKGFLQVDLDTVYTHFDHPDLGQERRTYLPEATVQAQMSNRVLLEFSYFGIYHGDTFPADAAEPAPKYGLGDMLLGTWLTVLKPGRHPLTGKIFFQVKGPNAEQERFLGTDKTDLFFGALLHWQQPKWSLSTLARFDVLGRFGTDTERQWDYLTTALHVEAPLFSSLRLYGEGWYRTRTRDSSGMAGLGLQAPLTKKWQVSLFAGDGFHDFYVPSLDSQPERRFKLSFSWRGHSRAFAQWLGD